jgi:hypothetical protein
VDPVIDVDHRRPVIKRIPREMPVPQRSCGDPSSEIETFADITTQAHTARSRREEFLSTDCKGLMTGRDDRSASRDEDRPRETGRARPRAADAVREALDQFEVMTGKQPDSVSGVRRSDEGGWSVLVDVLELERVPSSTSVMATYRVDVDAEGELLSYERLRRYSRGTTDSS